MKVQPRQQLLEVWRGVVARSYRDGAWQWGGRYGANSISDAEQLLCLMSPATSVETFGLDEPDRTGEDVLAALSDLGTGVEVPQVLIHALTEYMQRYTDADGTPIFTSDGYFFIDDEEKHKQLTEA